MRNIIYFVALLKQQQYLQFCIVSLLPEVSREKLTEIMRKEEEQNEEIKI